MQGRQTTSEENKNKNELKTNYKNSSGHNETNSKMNILHENASTTKENKARNHETKEKSLLLLADECLCLPNRDGC